MRKVIAVVWVILLCGTAWGMDFPAIGQCNGRNIRLREFPGPKGKTAGYVNTGTELVILGDVTVNDQRWFKVDHPLRKGNVWIPAQYVIFTGERAEEIFVRVRLMLGINQNKTRAILGRPDNFDIDRLEYPGLRLWYDSFSLQRAEVSRRGFAFGGVNVGDKPGALAALGMPEGWDKDNDTWTLEGAGGEAMSFVFGEKGIESMSWERPVKTKGGRKL